MSEDHPVLCKEPPDESRDSDESLDSGLQGVSGNEVAHQVMHYRPPHVSRAQTSSMDLRQSNRNYRSSCQIQFSPAGRSNWSYRQQVSHLLHPPTFTSPYNPRFGTDYGKISPAMYIGDLSFPREMMPRRSTGQFPPWSWQERYPPYTHKASGPSDGRTGTTYARGQHICTTDQSFEVMQRGADSIRKGRSVSDSGVDHNPKLSKWAWRNLLIIKLLKVIDLTIEANSDELVLVAGSGDVSGKANMENNKRKFLTMYRNVVAGIIRELLQKNPLLIETICSLTVGSTFEEGVRNTNFDKVFSCLYSVVIKAVSNHEHFEQNSIQTKNVSTKMHKLLHITLKRFLTKLSSLGRSHEHVSIVSLSKEEQILSKLNLVIDSFFTNNETSTRRDSQNTSVLSNKVEGRSENPDGGQRPEKIFPGTSESDQFELRYQFDSPASQEYILDLSSQCEIDSSANTRKGQNQNTFTSTFIDSSMIQGKSQPATKDKSLAHRGRKMSKAKAGSIASEPKVDVFKTQSKMLHAHKSSISSSHSHRLQGMGKLMKEVINVKGQVSSVLSDPELKVHQEPGHVKIQNLDSNNERESSQGQECQTKTQDDTTVRQSESILHTLYKVIETEGKAALEINVNEDVSSKDDDEMKQTQSRDAEDSNSLALSPCGLIVESVSSISEAEFYNTGMATETESMVREGALRQQDPGLQSAQNLCTGEDVVKIKQEKDPYDCEFRPSENTNEFLGNHMTENERHYGAVEAADFSFNTIYTLQFSSSERSQKENSMVGVNKDRVGNSSDTRSLEDRIKLLQVKDASSGRSDAADDHSRCYQPPAPNFNSFFDRYNCLKERSEGMRDVNRKCTSFVGYCSNVVRSVDSQMIESTLPKTANVTSRPTDRGRKTNTSLDKSEKTRATSANRKTRSKSKSSGDNDSSLKTRRSESKSVTQSCLDIKKTCNSKSANSKEQTGKTRDRTVPDVQPLTGEAQLEYDSNVPRKDRDFEGSLLRRGAGKESNGKGLPENGSSRTVKPTSEGFQGGLTIKQEILEKINENNDNTDKTLAWLQNRFPSALSMTETPWKQDVVEESSWDRHQLDHDRSSGDVVRNLVRDPGEVTSPGDVSSSVVSTCRGSLVTERGGWVDDIATLKSYYEENDEDQDQDVGTIGQTLHRVKERKTYTDVDIDDDEIEGKRNYALDEKLRTGKYSRKYVQVLKGEDFNLSYLQEHGLEFPIVFYEKAGLGLRVPSENFKVSDVKQCVGSRRMLDVMDVTTQKGMEMSMREWVVYYENKERQRLLNVISLEFSHTKLENYVESPNLVRQIDWVDTVWPRHLKEGQTEATNIIEKMKYPKVQKYCLMSVAGCYTDFHIDFGGTSVWYHILHGEKVFWLIPPTEKNVEIYTNWVLSGKQGDIFLADHVEGCERIMLKAGYTFIIPSGWIHAVYTPEDSLVFGGNFLHSYNIVNQLRVSEVEDKTHVPQKFRYPFYAEIAWYVLARYITCVTGKQCLELPVEDKENDEDKRESSPFVLDDSSRPSSRCSQDSEQKPTESYVQPATPKFGKKVMIELTRIDQAGKIKSYSDDENSNNKRIKSPRKSSSDSCSSADTEIYEKMEEVSDSSNVQGGSEKSDNKTNVKRVNSMSDESSSQRMTKRENKTYFLTQCEIKGLWKLIDWLEDLPPSKKGVPKDMINADEVLLDIKKLLKDHASDDPKSAITGEPLLVWPPSKKPPKPKVYRLPSGGRGPKAQSSKGSSSSGVRRRRTRCRRCEPCTRSDCGECTFCKDMRKYGGPGRMKQSCKSRQCLAPVISNAAFCMICGKDERINIPGGQGETATTLMECGICWEIVHPDCLKQKYENLDNEGNVNEDLPNSWECPKCCHDGKQGQLKPRVVKLKKEGEVQSPKPESMTSSNESLNTIKHESDTESKRVTAKLAEEVKAEEDTEEYEDQEVDPENINERVTSPVLPTLKTPPTKSKLKTTKHGSASVRGRKFGGMGAMSVSPKKSLKIIRRGTSLSPGRGRGIRKGMSPDSTTRDISPQLEETPPESVFTRSGRKVKRSPFSDENLETEHPKKRPKREGLVSKPEVTDGNGVKVVKSQGFSSPGQHKKMKRFQNYGSSTEEDSVSPERFGDTAKKKVSTIGKYGLGKSRSLPTTASQLAKKGPKKYLSDALDKPVGRQPKVDTGGRGQAGFVREESPKLVSSKFVVRPVAPPPPPDCVELENGDIHPLKRKLWTKIFSYLPYPDLARCLSVSKAFNRWGMNHELWSVIDLSRKRIVQAHLIGLVKRQPRTLHLNAVIMTQKQLSWLLARIPQLKHLSLSSCSWATVSALCFSACPLLHSVNLSWSLGLNEQCFKDLVSPPSDLRPGMKEISRLHKVQSLSVAGTDIEDASLGHIAQYLNSLEKLDISFCQRITDRGIQLLTDSNNGAPCKTLRSLDISGLRELTEVCLESLNKCAVLQSVKIVKCPKITMDVIRKFPRKTVAFVK